MKHYEPMMRLKIKRIEKGFTQRELSKMTGIRENMISCYENGIYYPRKKVLDKLAEALDCQVKDIV